MVFMKITPKKIGTIFCIIGCSTQVYAAKPVDLSKGNFPQGVVNTLSGINSAYTTKVLKTRTDFNHMTHMRVQQFYHNLPVFGADAVIHVPASSSLKATPHNVQPLLYSQLNVRKNGIFFADIEKDLPQPYEGLNSPQNQILAIQSVKKSLTPNASTQFSDEKAEPMVYVDKNQKAHFSYRVSYLAKTPNEIPKQPIAIVDAKSHELYQAWDNIKTDNPQLEPAVGLGYGGNPLMGKWLYGKDKPGLPISRSISDQRCIMKNEMVTVLRKKNYDFRLPGDEIGFNCVESEENGFLEPDDGLFGQSNGAYSPINDALHYGMIIQKFYMDWYGVPVLTQADGKPLQLSMNLLYLNGPYENAFWESTGKRMYFGMGGFSLYPLVTLGIAAHEISHGFTDEHSNLLYKDQSGAINEAFSDMAISAVSYYASNGQEAEWSTGSEVLKSNNGKPKSRWEAVRYFDKPTQDGYSIAHIKDMQKLESFCQKASQGNPLKYQSCIVHLASGVYNKVFYQLATAEGWNPRQAFEVMVKANLDYWTANATFQSAACGTKQAAIDIAKQKPFARLDALDEAFNSVGISISAC